MLHPLIAAAFGLSFQEGKRISTVLRVQPKNGRSAHGLHLVQESLLHQPGKSAFRLLQTAVYLLFEQPPTRDSFKAVCRIRISQKIAQDLFHDFAFRLCSRQVAPVQLIQQLSCQCFIPRMPLSLECLIASASKIALTKLGNALPTLSWGVRSNCHSSLGLGDRRPGFRMTRALH